MVPGTGRSPDGSHRPTWEKASMIGDESTSDRLRIELAAEPLARSGRAVSWSGSSLHGSALSWSRSPSCSPTSSSPTPCSTPTATFASRSRRLPTGVRVEVSDHNVAPVSPRSASVHAEGGSGLDLVEGIFDEWGVERWDGGKPSGSRSFSNARHRSTRPAELCSRVQTISAAPAAANATMVR